MASPPLLDDPAHLARRAKTRVAIAAVLLTIAIGGLTLLTRQQPPKEAVGEPAAQKQESISSGPAASAEQQPAPAQISSKEIEPPTPAPSSPVTQEPEKQVAPAPVAPPPPPQVSNPQPIKNTPAPALKANVPKSPVPSEPVAPAPPESKKPVPKAKPVEATKPSPVPAVAPAEPPTKPGPAPKSFVVQVGVFTDMDNAKVLQSKLAENGIPSHTETKLQVGPFNTKAEADNAREKLKNLGIGSVVVPGK